LKWRDKCRGKLNGRGKGVYEDFRKDVFRVRYFNAEMFIKSGSFKGFNA
jgi:hypothetical protein